jgi:putative nucleotidyltransferase with HDIG domain
MTRIAHPPQRLVPSGSYYISGTKNEILSAHLGTCVGVTLCDRRAKVGGLIHLLLPEPTGINKPWQPESYATTGLPLFIRALCNAGASRNNIDACVAGGALVGCVSEKDLDFDIGGRTTEAVERILRREGIPTGKSETGGYFTCQLSLSLKTWESRIEPIGSQSTPPTNEFKKPSSRQLESVIRRVRPIPQVALKIIRMIRDNKYGMEEVGGEIRQDQVLSANVIRICNSALLGLRNKIQSVDRALVVLGEKQLLQLVISASLETFFPITDRGYSLCKGGLYKHALGTAMTAERLARFTGRISGDIAYTAGLLHDIGKVVLDQYLAPAFPLFYRKTQVEDVDLIVTESNVFGVSHPEIGGGLAERWSLPESLIDTIRYHHHPEQATVNPSLTHLVYLADLLISRFLVGQELERLNADAIDQRLEKIGLSLSQFPIIVDLIPQTVFGTYLFT